jgi:microcystin-dependent protein
VAEPTTVNIGLIIPNTGDLAGTWGSAAVNPDFSAIDGLLGGVQTISVSNVNVVLTSPAGFTPTPGGGPTQAQNAVIKFTGALTGAVQVTLPVPGFYIIDNSTSGNFVLSLRALGAGAVIGVDQGEVIHVYNDGSNVKFVNFPRIGQEEMWDGYTAMPAWVTACTNAPYLLCDGSVYNISAFPVLGNRLLGQFGGNGITTFGVPDRRGRMALPYDGTGTRITAAGCGINGQTLGASQDKQTNVLVTTNLPPYSPSGTITNGKVTLSSPASIQGGPGTNSTGGGVVGATLVASSVVFSQAASTFAGDAQGGTSAPVNNVQPAIVTGIAVIRAA